MRRRVPSAALHVAARRCATQCVRFASRRPTHADIVNLCFVDGDDDPRRSTRSGLIAIRYRRSRRRKATTASGVRRPLGHNDMKPSKVVASLRPPSRCRTFRRSASCGRERRLDKATVTRAVLIIFANKPHGCRPAVQTGSVVAAPGYFLDHGEPHTRSCAGDDVPGKSG